MMWPGKPSPDPSSSEATAAAEPTATTNTTSSSRRNPSGTSPAAAAAAPPPAGPLSLSLSWNDSLNATDWSHFAEPRNWIPTLLLTATVLGSLRFYRSYLRRIPGAAHIQPQLFRRRSLLGRVTSVGDGDGFHMFHTPGGRLAGWGWLRSVPAARKELKGRTISVRIAGIDAPEGAHFGRPAQPFAAEALAFLSSYILHRPVRAYIYKRDQYERVVATVWVRRWLFWRRDVGLELLRRGLATTYEARSGAEFGGLEARYRRAEERAKSRGLGIWGGKGVFESPREYKRKVAEEGGRKGL